MRQAQPFPQGPSRKVLWALALGVLVLHVVLLLGVMVPLQVHLGPTQPGPVQVRVVPPVPVPVVKPPPVARAKAAAAPPLAAQAAGASEPEAVVPAADPVTAETALVSTPTETPALAAEPVAPAVQQARPEVATAWPLISLGALPPSSVLSYQLTGMDKGLTYHASGELRWQHNGTAYALTLSVRAFLLGSRHWRSVGQIDAAGLAPKRFSDSWRNERAAHFDREQQRIVFSSNSTPAALEPGAQDQVSLYVQLAAAMAGEPERFAPGARLQVQTATVRDAVPWSLVLQGVETLTLNGQPVQAYKWICQPRNQYEARVEFWVTGTQTWLPVRIRITQASGSYIDLLWRGTEPLPSLPVGTDTTDRDRGS